jgi:RHS repeat-associated protein
LLDSYQHYHTVAWDPTESVATRPLALQTPSGWFTYAFDRVKNVTELFDASGTLAETYDYAPFGALTAATGPAVSLNPLTFSSEIGDTALGLQYYNFRHLNTLDGRWLSRDPIGEGGGVNVFVYNNNGGINDYDILGLMIVRNDVPSVVVSPPIVISPPSWPPSTTPPVTPDCMCEPGSKRGVRPDPLYTQPAPNGCGPGWSGDVKLNDPMKFVFPFSNHVLSKGHVIITTIVTGLVVQASQLVTVIFMLR